MATIQVKNVPTDLNERLRRYAAQEGRTISDVILAALQRELERHTFVKRLRSRSSVTLKRSPARLLMESRLERDPEP
jgi:plasmid stability protein